MKRTILIVTLLLSSFVFTTADAQVRVTVRANIGTQPGWGPTGYDYAEYYYLPDIDIFYSVPRHQYIYRERGRWTFSSYLPRRYRDFDINTGYKVVVNDRTPYRNAQMYRNKYSSYKGHHDQEIIRNSREPKYFENKDHPEHNKWKRERNHNKRSDHQGRGN